VRVAIVCYYAPPLRAIASHRVLRMTRALLRAGHEVHWVAADADRMHDPQESVDESLRTLIPREVVQHRIGGQALVAKPAAAHFIERAFRNLALGLPKFMGIDGFFGWSRVLRRRLVRLLKKQRIGAVVLCCSPHSQIALMPRLRRALFGLRIFVDYRGLQPRRQARLVRLERRLLRSANVLFVSTTAARSKFLQTVGEIGLPVEVMRNAADYGIADGIERRILAPDLGDGAHLGYFGTLSPRRRLLPFLTALGRLPAEQLQQITVHVYADADGSREVLAEDLLAGGETVAARVVRHDYLPFAQALRCMQVMDALLLVGANDSDGVHVPGVLYDYLMARRPVLFVGPGEAADIVTRACGPESCFEHDAPEPLGKAIAGMIESRPSDTEPVRECRPVVAFGPLLSHLEPHGLD